MPEFVRLLNSSGAIISPSVGSGYVPFDRVFSAPVYVEQVMLPVVTVDSAALYGEHPEKLAQLTYSSGAVLTFFVDSVAGGNDMSGDGSFDAPWRSLRRAQQFISCADCELFAAAEYVQLKVRGTVDYLPVVSTSTWRFRASGGDRLILTGWGERCDLTGSGGTMYAVAQYAFNVRVAGLQNDYGRATVCSGCEITASFGGGASTIVDCSGANMAASVAYGCSGGEVVAPVLHGGVCSSAVCTYAYSPTVSLHVTSGGTRGASHTMLTVSSAAVSAVVSGAVVDVGAYYNGGSEWWTNTALTGIRAGGMLRDCVIDLSATASGGTAVKYAAAQVDVCPIAGLYGHYSGVISGGRLTAVASAYASAISSASATARASGLHSGATATGVQTTLIASGAAVVTAATGSATAYEGEYIYNGASICSDTRERRYYNGVVTSTTHSSGCDQWY